MLPDHVSGQTSQTILNSNKNKWGSFKKEPLSIVTDLISEFQTLSSLEVTLNQSVAAATLTHFAYGYHC